MFTQKDIEFRTIFVINCIEERGLRVKGGELLLEEIKEDRKVTTLTKIPFQKVLALFVIGHITITTPLIENCKKYNVALIVLKPSLRPVFYWSDSAEANYLLRKRQYCSDGLCAAQSLVSNKISNQMQLLLNTRRKDAKTRLAIEHCRACLDSLPGIDDRQQLLGIEGTAARYFFAAYFHDYNWSGRQPRTKKDYINATLDIGYTLLFNFIECYLRMFGFDLYIGVFHTEWYKRKSLVCDMVEPFRCIIERTIRTSINRKQISIKDYELKANEYHLKKERCGDYYHLFFDALIPYKSTIFKYIQSYYRCFMGRKSVVDYPVFEL
ncbi:MAG: type V CRISPR-associated endonuclease Cas1 [Bacteroidia bacterium]|nr:type V CRISPR-associated endonuclease Cas1 [Bacteroidia bacterium]